MSGWDWIHAGLEVATFTKAQKASSDLANMKASTELETARRAFLELMRSYIFEISRDIKLAEEQITEFPQQVYIVAKSLELRLKTSGFTADLFPDFQDKEYVFNTEKKVAEVIKNSGSDLTDDQIEQSQTAIKYISEMPLLQDAISTTSAHETLLSTNDEWQSIKSKNSNKKSLKTLGVIGLIVSACVGFPMIASGMGMLAVGEFDTGIGGLLILMIGGAIPAGSIALLAKSGKINPRYKELKAEREEL